MLKRLLLSLSACAALLSSAPVNAGSGLDELARIEVLDGGPTKRGTYMAAIRMTLSDGWKTYWRAPGDTGIPPSFHWRGSRNLGSVAMTWPAPEIFDTAGSRTLGYSRQMVLPIEITPTTDGKPVRIKGKIDFGLCSDVCIPASLKFDHELDVDALRNPAIAAALAQRPFSATEAGVTSATCHLTPTANGMSIKLQLAMPSTGGKEIVVIEPGDPQLWVGDVVTRRSGKTLTAAADLVSASGQSFGLDRSRVRITVLGQDHSVDIRGCSAG